MKDWLWRMLFIEKIAYSCAYASIGFHSCAGSVCYPLTFEDNVVDTDPMFPRKHFLMTLCALEVQTNVQIKNHLDVKCWIYAISKKSQKKINVWINTLYYVAKKNFTTNHIVVTVKKTESIVSSKRCFRAEEWDIDNVAVFLNCDCILCAPSKLNRINTNLMLWRGLPSCW